MANITVWLTSYNHASFLRESIESILNQTWRDFELYIIDDCSTDGSWEIIQSYQDPRIHAIRHETNWGQSGLRQMLDSLSGEYLAIAHSDDKWMPDKLEKQLNFLQEHPDVAACFTQVQVINEEGNPLKDEKHVYYNMFCQENRSRFEWLRFFFDHGNCLCHPSVLIRREAYSKYGLLTNGLSGIPDFIQWVRLCHHAEIWIYPEKLSCFRVRSNEQNTSGDSAEKHYRNFIEQFLTLGEYVDFNCAEEFLKIFPECQKYEIDGDILLEYAYARVLLESEHSPGKHLYAYQLLYNLMQNSESRNKLETLYGYTQRMFEKEKQREDIFSLIPESSFMNAALYYDVGDGFDEQHCLHQKIYITHEQKFFVRFQLPASDHEIKALRFDPDCNYWRAFWNICAQVDGKRVELVPVDATRESGKDYFFTLDSQYLLQGVQSSSRVVQIEGKCTILPSAQLDQKIRELVQVQDSLQKLTRELSDERSQNEARSQHEQQLEKELTNLMSEIHTHPWRMMARIFLKRI